MSTEEEQATPLVSPFESIRRFSEEGIEYWSARDLAKVLGYTEYGKFKNATHKAEMACENSGQDIPDHFAHVSDMITTGKGAQRKVDDIHLSRYACYLLIENADSSKPIVALGQTYFAVQTRRQELADEAALPEDQLRLLRRSQMVAHNSQLADAAQHAGVIRPVDFAVFQDHGYSGLYGGLKAKDIHTRKGLKKSQHILDHMGSDELAANIFRASLTKQKLERENIQHKDEANRAHQEMGQAVRETIIRTGTTLPEDLPTPTKSIQQLQREEQKKLERQQQQTLFDEPSMPEEEE